MPYRRLPNTDVARQRALRTAYEKGKELPPFKLSFSQGTFREIQSFLPVFEKAMIEHKQAYKNQIEKNKDYQLALKKAKLYISHFIQVMNMAIARGDLMQKNRVYYGLGEKDRKLPSLNTEADVIKWGENIIKGEDSRKMKGLTLITNPTIAVVKVRYENFLDAYKFQKTLQKNNNRFLRELAILRDQADNIIVNIWNEVEHSYRDLPEKLRRDKASEYGVTYVYRKNEIDQIEIMGESRINSVL